MNIIKAHIEHLDYLIPLFDSYRIFYRQQSNKKAAREFLFERLKNKDAVIFIAFEDSIAIGFTQLYPLFSSVSMEPIYLLNDLYVDASFRNQGVGEALINRSKTHCEETDVKGMAIQTELTNQAQHLYERLEFIKDPDLHFFWTNTKK